MKVSLNFGGKKAYFESLEELEKFEDSYDMRYNEGKDLISEARETFKKCEKENEEADEEFEDSVLDAISDIAEIVDDINERLLAVEEKLSCHHNNKKCKK